jgi:hypothetical protein
LFLSLTDTFAQVDLELTILLPPSPAVSYNYRHTLPHLVGFLAFSWD